MTFENIKELAKENDNFRKVIYTGHHSQLVLMGIPVGEDIGKEVHTTSDQIIFIVEGDATADVANQTSTLRKHSVVFIPSGAEHNITNTGDETLKLYTVYSPSVHADGIIHKTKADAAKEEKIEI